MNLKRGDRVRLKEREHLAGLPKGSIGTVLRDHDLGGDSIAVSFDGFTGGHWADGVIPNTEPASGWYVLSRDIELHMEETTNASNANCQAPSHETANLELQKDVDGSRPVDASTNDAERHVHQGSERRCDNGKKRNH